MRVGIIQPNYIPWKGYFDFINSVDLFILYDTVQYTKRDWRNRNKVKTPNGTQWVSIPVLTKGLFPNLLIKDAVVENQIWRKKHWRTFEFYYKKAPYFEKYAERFYRLYMEDDEKLLAQIDYKFIVEINDILGIDTPLRWASEFQITAKDKNLALLQLLEQVGATVYLSGPAAKDYLDVDLFNEHGIEVEWMDYSGYPEYPQLYSPPFIHEVTVLDLIFNVGPDAPRYMKSFKK